jgi:hypothetical protein
LRPKGRPFTSVENFVDLHERVMPRAAAVVKAERKIYAARAQRL